jgi:hypothetical protein
MPADWEWSRNLPSSFGFLEINRNWKKGANIPNIHKTQNYFKKYSCIVNPLRWSVKIILECLNASLLANFLSPPPHLFSGENFNHHPWQALMVLTLIALTGSQSHKSHIIQSKYKYVTELYCCRCWSRKFLGFQPRRKKYECLMTYIREILLATLVCALEQQEIVYIKHLWGYVIVG